MNFPLRKLWSLVLDRSTSRKSRSAVLAVEALENRCLMSASPAFSLNAPILPNLPGAKEQVYSTVPATLNEGNPYGVAFVPQGFQGNGVLKPGDLLVENFNGVSGFQATGTTIQRITPSGQTSTFFTSKLIGLDTALGVLKAGYVIIGNAPNSDPINGGTTVDQGALQILNANGKVVLTLTSSRLLDGPWDLTIQDDGNFAYVFVSNVLSGTVTRIDLALPNHGNPFVLSEAQIASGYGHGLSGPALVVGPTGLAFDQYTDTLYVASTVNNEIFAVPNALTTNQDHGRGSVFVHSSPYLHGPLGLVMAPNGDLIVANGDAIDEGGTPNDLVEFNSYGNVVGTYQVDPGVAGAAFGIAFTVSGNKLEFAAVDDNTNTVEVFTLPFGHGGI